MVTRRGDEKVVESSGDVYRDMGIELTPEETLKVELALEFTRIVNDRDYTQREVATIIGADQSKVSNILRGKIKDFSIERLLRFLLALGTDFDVHLSPTKNEGKIVSISKEAREKPREGSVRVYANAAGCR
ncbi:XRE family transcriptional regulator [Mesorhizobium sp. LNJC399B00]|uniref:helix-turn-helix domain-containing protein n=1 Tax=unclassified Mesorhizobium TaxID=325217 RepID=UPI0003CE48BE|nr:MULTISPECIES: helix-turn-helix transcriptional regulator [unclassified Mesorhizobium]ESX99151.1 XRE family transcriptional regulator [Mesorhizobium sp. LNJC399B00]WJI67425.1 helix-turn-helix domain-containing protein [Mesorhizobium sp. C399B]